MQTKLQEAHDRIRELEDFQYAYTVTHNFDKTAEERRKVSGLERVLFHCLSRLQSLLLQLDAVDHGQQRARAIQPSIDQADQYIEDKLGGTVSRDFGGPPSRTHVTRCSDLSHELIVKNEQRLFPLPHKSEIELERSEKDDAAGLKLIHSLRNQVEQARVEISALELACGFRGQCFCH